jgi:CHAD domain-containing protein
MEPEYVKLREIKPALTGYIRRALLLLHRSAIPDEKAVHDVRVLMKKSRAVMKLISDQVEKESIERDYNAFREVGRIMSTWRETSVHRKVLKDIKKNHQELFSALAGNQKLETLLIKAELPQEPGPELKEMLEALDEHLSKAGYRLRFQPMNNFDPKLLLNGLDKSYRDIVDTYLKCRHKPVPANVHNFRKKVKEFLYQLWFFRPLNPVVVKALEKRLDSLTQNLGKLNDLSVLLDTLDYKYSGPGNDIAMDELALIIRAEQDKYLLKVWPQAFKIFSPGKNLVNMLGFKILII